MIAKLVNAWKQCRAAWAGLGGFNRLAASRKELVFYAETAADWAFLGPVAEALERRGKSIVRICSDPADPALQKPDAFFVGFGTARTTLFRSIQARAFIMTLSDLETFHLKRSVHPVHYFYIFHSIASTHRTYRLHAFDAYDTILCVGPHHEPEIRRMEEVYHLRPKRLLRHGYGRLDTLMADMQKQPAAPPDAPRARPLRILLAPTWGECSIVHHGIEMLIETLLAMPCELTLRFHPMTRRQQPDLPDRLARRFAGNGTLSIDPHINTTESLLGADVLISEWSGAAIEYALARLQPVIFIDTPPKVHNPEFDRLDLPCLEETLREKIGVVVAPADMEQVPHIARRLVEERAGWAERIRAVRETTVYHLGRSGEVGADLILETLTAGEQT